MLQRLGEMIPVPVAMAVNLKNAVVKIFSVFSSSLPKPQNFSFRVKNTVTSK
jgi:hypothetical protein